MQDRGTVSDIGYAENVQLATRKPPIKLGGLLLIVICLSLVKNTLQKSIVVH
jgi:hypothetical protein